MAIFISLMLFCVALFLTVRGGDVHSQATSTSDGQTVPPDVAVDGVVACFNTFPLIRKKWGSTVRG